MNLLAIPNGHGEVIFSLTSNNYKMVYETYESKPSTGIDIERCWTGIEVKFYEDKKETDRWIVGDMSFKDISSVFARFPEIRRLIEA